MSSINYQFVAIGLSIFALLAANADNTNDIKFTNIKCNCSATTCIVNMCRLKAINRSLIVVNINFTLLKDLHDVRGKFKLFKKENQYQPFPLSGEEDLCKFLKSSKGSIILPLLKKAFFPYTNIPKICPLTKYFTVTKMPINGDVIPSAFPSGEYRFDVDIHSYGSQMALMQFYIEVKDLTLFLKRQKIKP